MSYRASRAAAAGVSSPVDVSVVNCGDALQTRDKLHHGGLGSGGGRGVSKRNQVPHGSLINLLWRLQISRSNFIWSKMDFSLQILSLSVSQSVNKVLIKCTCIYL